MFLGEDIVRRLSQLDTCAVSDALDRLGVPGAAIGIRPLWPSCPPIVGRVVTVKLKPIGLERPTQHLGAAAIDAARAGDVLVVDNGGRVEVASWGGLLSLAAQARQINGVILDGACRDVDEIQGLGFPVYARAAVPVTARGRITQESLNQEILCAGVTVRPDDLAIADGSGVIFIPSGKAAAVVAEAEAIAQRQQQIADAIRAGRSVSEVMESMGYEGMLQRGEQPSYE